MDWKKFQEFEWYCYFFICSLLYVFLLSLILLYSLFLFCSLFLSLTLPWYLSLLLALFLPFLSFTLTLYILALSCSLSTSPVLSFTLHCSLYHINLKFNVQNLESNEIAKLPALVEIKTDKKVKKENGLWKWPNATLNIILKWNNEPFMTNWIFNFIVFFFCENPIDYYYFI